MRTPICSTRGVTSFGTTFLLPSHHSRDSSIIPKWSTSNAPPNIHASLRSESILTTCRNAESAVAACARLGSSVFPRLTGGSESREIMNQASEWSRSILVISCARDFASSSSPTFSCSSASAQSFSALFAMTIAQVLLRWMLGWLIFS